MNTSQLKRTIGLVGGTFDPIHLGHLRVALEVQEQLQLDEVRFIPCHIPPHRETPQVSAQQRLDMLKLAIAQQPNFVADERELHRSIPSYTLDTLKNLRAELGSQVTLYFIMGADAFSQIDQWYEWKNLLNYAHLIVISRPGYSSFVHSDPIQAWLEEHQVKIPAELTTRSHGKILQLSVTALDISASQIRQARAEGKSINFLLPESVIGYIETHGLYNKKPS